MYENALADLRKANEDRKVAAKAIAAHLNEVLQLFPQVLSSCEEYEFEEFYIDDEGRMRFSYDLR